MRRNSRLVSWPRALAARLSAPAFAVAIAILAGHSADATPASEHSPQAHPASRAPRLAQAQEASCHATTWQPKTQYHTKDVVRYSGNGRYYVATHDNPGYDPTLSTWFWSSTTCGGSGDIGGGATGETHKSGKLPDQFEFKAGGGANGDTPLHKGWKLVWEDDFSKDKQVDRSKWNFEIDGKGGGNHELEYYTDSPKTARIENGELVITALKNDAGHKFTSARMTTKGKFSFRYGRAEASIRTPKAQAGNWPAFWMLPEANKYGGWPRSGEIDIMEMIGKSDKLYGTCHYGGEHGDLHTGAQVASHTGDFTTDYHVYAVEWEPKELRWYVDGRYYGSVHDWHSASAPFPAPFDQKFFIILNYAVGGAWPGSPDASSTFPQSMRVKYVRVYQP